jgi:hypothetical protein
VCRHLGFTEKAWIQDGFALGDAMVLLEMRRENCRWLTGNGWRTRRLKEAA